MTDHLLFLIVGLGAGAAYAALAMALVTTYRGTGVINIAQGAMAMWAAFVYDELRRQGDLVLPVGRVDLGGGLQVWPALLTGVAVAAAPGADPPRRGVPPAAVGAAPGQGRGLGGRGHRRCRRWSCCASAPAAGPCRPRCPTTRCTSAR